MDAKSVKYNVGDVYRSKYKNFRVRILDIKNKAILLELLDPTGGYTIGYQYTNYSMYGYIKQERKQTRTIPWL